MNKLFLIIALVCMAFCTYASDYSYLVIHQINGANTYMEANGTRFSATEGKLTAVHANGTYKFDLSDISYMAFTNDPAGIKSVFSENGGETDVFSDQGLYVGHYGTAEAARQAIPTSGVYIFKNSKGIAKILITK